MTHRQPINNTCCYGQLHIFVQLLLLLNSLVVEESILIFFGLQVDIVVMMCSEFMITAKMGVQGVVDGVKEWLWGFCWGWLGRVLLIVVLLALLVFAINFELLEVLSN